MRLIISITPQYTDPYSTGNVYIQYVFVTCNRDWRVCVIVQSVMAGLRHMEVNNLWAYLCFIGRAGLVNHVGLHTCARVRKTRGAQNESMYDDIPYVSFLIVRLTLQRSLFCYGKTYVALNCSNHWQGKCVWVSARGERCEQRLIAKPFPKALSRSVSWRVPFQRQFVYCWALWQRGALWWTESVVLCAFVFVWETCVCVCFCAHMGNEPQIL